MLREALRRCARPVAMTSPGFVIAPLATGRVLLEESRRRRSDLRRVFAIGKPFSAPLCRSLAVAEFKCARREEDVAAT